MEPIRRKKRIPYDKFCEVFTQRSFTTRDKLSRNIYIVEDVDGNYRIEEHPTFLGYVFYAALLIVAFIPVFVYEGVVGLLKLGEEVTTLIKRKPLRTDELKHNIPSNAKLLEYTGWITK